MCPRLMCMHASCLELDSELGLDTTFTYSIRVFVPATRGREVMSPCALWDIAIALVFDDFSLIVNDSH